MGRWNNPSVSGYTGTTRPMWIDAGSSSSTISNSGLSRTTRRSLPSDLPAVEDDPLVPLEELPEEGPPEPERGEVARLVAEGDLDRRPGAAAGRGHAEDGPLHHGGLSEGELVEGHELPAVLVVPGEVVQGVPDRHEPQALELAGALGPHTLDVLEGGVEAGGRLGGRIHGRDSRAGSRRQACLTSDPMV